VATFTSPATLQLFAAEFVRRLRGGVIFLLRGDVGAGKTTFAQGLARGLDVREEVTSPTFLLLRRYEGTRPFCHVDAYRLRPEEVEPLVEEIEEDILRGAIVAVEWPEHMSWLWRFPTLDVEISGAGDEPRRVVLRALTPEAVSFLTLAEDVQRAFVGREEEWRSDGREE